MHLYPACVCWTLRWHTAGPLADSLKEDPAAAASWAAGGFKALVLFPVAPYLLWSVLYYLKASAPLLLLLRRLLLLLLLLLRQRRRPRLLLPASVVVLVMLHPAFSSVVPPLPLLMVPLPLPPLAGLLGRLALFTFLSWPRLCPWCRSL